LKIKLCPEWVIAVDGGAIITRVVLSGAVRCAGEVSDH